VHGQKKQRRTEETRKRTSALVAYSWDSCKCAVFPSRYINFLLPFQRNKEIQQEMEFYRREVGYSDKIRQSMHKTFLNYV